MARVEAPVYSEEKKSKWSARLVWGGLGIAALGAFLGISEVAAVGVIAFGGGMILWRRKKK